METAGSRRRPASIGQLLASDPALDAVVLVGWSLADTTRGVPGTWEWTGRRWSPLSGTTPDGADSLGYDPISHRLLAYGGQQPSTPAADMGAPSTSGYSRTWAFVHSRWVQLHPPTTPDRAPGVLTISPDRDRLLLITTRGQTWAWTGHNWQPYPARDAPGSSQWTGSALSAATDPSRHQIVLLMTSDNANDQTWTLSGGRWTRHLATP